MTKTPWRWSQPFKREKEAGIEEKKKQRQRRERERVCVCACVEVCAEKSQSLTPLFIPLQQIRAIMCEQGKDRPAEFPQGQKGLQLLHFHQVNCDVTHLPYGAKIGTPLSHVGMTPSCSAASLCNGIQKRDLWLSEALLRL